jgi:dethiobiotin synthetase
MKLNQLFVTGTDTDVGKTVVSAILARGLRARYWKPVQTGTVEGRDSEFVERWCGKDASFPETFRFKDPVSPHLAAHREGAQISLSAIREYYEREVAGSAVVVEGAGGVKVPLNDDEFVIDMIAALSLPTIVVARSGLGTINHTLLTLEELQLRQIPVLGVVLTGPENADNARAIEYYGGVTVFGHVPRVQAFTVDWFDRTFENIFAPSFAGKPADSLSENFADGSKVERKNESDT